MRKIIFITGTRADYGKIKSLMKALEKSHEFEVYVYVSGMHLLERYGYTLGEIEKDGYKNIYPAFGQKMSDSMSYNLGNVICNLTGYVEAVRPDMIVVHGDRIEALAGAIVGAMNNVCVAHIEGGEVTGTIDESIRHSVSKFAHIHFVSNETARRNLIQLGESEDDIYVIGSPDIDIMSSKNLPTLEETKKRYEIPYKNYSILIYHPVTTELDRTAENVRELVSAIDKSNRQYIAIMPNNDSGSEIIQGALEGIRSNKVKLFPSIRFESFLTLMKNADCIIGNSSAGVREAGYYGIPVIDIGNRQKGRYILESNPNIQWVEEKEEDILMALDHIDEKRIVTHQYGDGDSTEKFVRIIRDKEFFDRDLQKKFIQLKNM